MKPKPATDLIVETGNPAALDQILQQFGAVVVQSNIDTLEYLQQDGGYVVRVFGDPGFVKFVITNQGYGKVLKTLDGLAGESPDALATFEQLLNSILSVYVGRRNTSTAIPEMTAAVRAHLASKEIPAGILDLVRLKPSVADPSRVGPGDFYSTAVLFCVANQLPVPAPEEVVNGCYLTPLGSLRDQGDDMSALFEPAAPKGD